MPKAVISNKIYLEVTPELRESIQQQLTYKIIPDGGNAIKVRGRVITKIETIKHYEVVNKKVIAIPQGRVDLIPEGYEIIDKRIDELIPFPNTNFDLNEAQVHVYNEVNGSCLINALPGWGKTFTALHIAKKLGQKTLIITHTVALRDQWANEIEKMFGHRPGVIGSGVEDVEDHFIVVSNVQTLIKVYDKYTKTFGTVIVDECHHTPATTFTKALTAFYAKYRIGLSGTLKRKDGKHVLFTDLFGHDVFKPPKSNTIDPIVYITRTGLMLTPNLPWVNKINDLLYNEDYQMFIANLAINQMNQGHRVLITADRVEFLVNVANFINAAKSESCVLITGSTETKSQTIRESLLKQVEDGEKMCVAASRQIFTEGLSLNILSCVILAVPTGNHIILEQLIGRIMRKHPIKDNLQPKVIDLTFSGFESKKQNESRLAFYLEKGWETVIV